MGLTPERLVEVLTKVTTAGSKANAGELKDLKAATQDSALLKAVDRDTRIRVRTFPLSCSSRRRTILPCLHSARRRADPHLLVA
jgi:hypothetical protein